jgi:hypothetical protein
MESLDEASATVTVSKSSTGKAIDRVTLGSEESGRLDLWLKQVNESSRGFLSLTKSDVVNFIVRNHKDAFDPKELTQIRGDHYEPVRHVTWLAHEIKAALACDDLPRVEELQIELQSVSLLKTKRASGTNAVKLPTHRVSRRKPKPEKQNERSSVNETVSLETGNG